MTDFLSRFFL